MTKRRRKDDEARVSYSHEIIHDFDLIRDPDGFLERVEKEPHVIQEILDDWGREITDVIRALEADRETIVYDRVLRWSDAIALWCDATKTGIDPTPLLEITHHLRDVASEHDFQRAQWFDVAVEVRRLKHECLFVSDRIHALMWLAWKRLVEKTSDTPPNWSKPRKLSDWAKKLKVAESTVTRRLDRGVYIKSPGSEKGAISLDLNRLPAGFVDD